MTHPSRGRLRASAIAACTLVLLLAGCDAEPRTDATGHDEAALPVAAPVADTAPRPDWKAAAYAALDCTTRAEWVADALPADAWDAETVRSTVADVTGDGVDEVLVQVTCPAPASTLPNHVVVLDVTGPTPSLLGVLGGDLFFPRATVTTSGTAVTLSGPTVAGDDPTCCPGHLGTVGYAWDGAGFVVRTRTEVPAPAAPASGPADGEHVGVLLSVGTDELTVDVVEWFEGTAARAACHEDGVEAAEGAWCTQYYVRGAGDGPLTLRVSDEATLSYLDLVSLERVPVGDVGQLAGTPWVSPDPDAAGYSRFRIDGGVVTALESIYTP